MKLFTSIAAAAVIGTSFIAATPADARTFCSTISSGTEHCIQRLRGNYRKVIVNNSFDSTGFYMFVDCNTKAWKANKIDGWDRDSLSAMADAACVWGQS